jgi:YggT family protein
MRAALFLISTIGELYVSCFLLRFLLQWVRADFHNPLSQFIVRVTSPLVRPIRKVVPGWRGMDMATILVALALELVLTLALITLSNIEMPAAGMLLLVVLQRLALTIARLFFFLVLVRAILSWVSQGGYHPVATILTSLTEPLVRPVRRLIPPIGGLDLAPLFVLIGLQALIVALG